MQTNVDSVNFANMAESYEAELFRIDELLNYMPIKKSLTPDDIQYHEQRKRRLVLQITIGCKPTMNNNIYCNRIIDIFKKLSKKIDDTCCCLLSVDVDHDGVPNVTLHNIVNWFTLLKF